MCSAHMRHLHLVIVVPTDNKPANAPCVAIVRPMIPHFKAVGGVSSRNSFVSGKYVAVVCTTASAKPAAAASKCGVSEPDRPRLSRSAQARTGAINYLYIFARVCAAPQGGCHKTRTGECEAAEDLDGAQLGHPSLQLLRRAERLKHGTEHLEMGSNCEAQGGVD